jgi:hypothetical protein
MVRTIFDQPEAVEVATQFDRVLTALETKLPKAAARLAEAREDPGNRRGPCRSHNPSLAIVSPHQPDEAQSTTAHTRVTQLVSPGEPADDLGAPARSYSEPGERRASRNRLHNTQSRSHAAEACRGALSQSTQQSRLRSCKRFDKVEPLDRVRIEFTRPGPLSLGDLARLFQALDAIYNDCCDLAEAMGRLGRSEDRPPSRVARLSHSSPLLIELAAAALVMRSALGFMK